MGSMSENIDKQLPDYYVFGNPICDTVLVQYTILYMQC